MTKANSGFPASLDWKLQAHAWDRSIASQPWCSGTARTRRPATVNCGMLNGLPPPCATQPQLLLSGRGSSARATALQRCSSVCRRGAGACDWRPAPHARRGDRRSEAGSGWRRARRRKQEIAGGYSAMARDSAQLSGKSSWGPAAGPDRRIAMRMPQICLLCRTAAAVERAFAAFLDGTTLSAACFRCFPSTASCVLAPPWPGGTSSDPFLDARGSTCCPPDRFSSVLLQAFSPRIFLSFLF